MGEENSEYYDEEDSSNNSPMPQNQLAKKQKQLQDANPNRQGAPQEAADEEEYEYESEEDKNEQSPVKNN